MKKVLKWIPVPLLILGVAADFLLDSAFERESGMDEMLGKWHCALSGADYYLTIQPDCQYKLQMHVYSTGETKTDSWNGSFSIDGSTISVDIPEKGTPRVYEVSFAEDTMTWKELQRESWSYTFEFRRSE